jgi:hypothetical protein
MTSQRKVTNGMQPLSCASLRTHDNEPTIAVCRVTKRTAMGQPLLWAGPETHDNGPTIAVRRPLQGTTMGQALSCACVSRTANTEGSRRPHLLGVPAARVPSLPCVKDRRTTIKNISRVRQRVTTVRPLGGLSRAGHMFTLSLLDSRRAIVTFAVNLVLFGAGQRCVTHGNRAFSRIGCGAIYCGTWQNVYEHVYARDKNMEVILFFSSACLLFASQ